MKTDPIKRALELRKTLVLDDKVLAADFTGTLEGIDTSRVIGLMPLIGTNCYPFRTKVNIKELDYLASKEYNAPFFDVLNKSDKEIEDFVKKQDFDFPLWYKKEADFKMNEVQFYNVPFILQVAGCNFHDGSSLGGCWYCFVDDKSNDGKPGAGKIYLGADETIESMLDAREKIKQQYAEAGQKNDLRVLRVSGGEPTIALDWILNLWRKITKKNLDFAGHLDSNLSTAKVVDYFESKGIFEKHILEKLAEYPIKVLTAIKGVDEIGLKSNVQSETTLEDQEYSIKRFIKAGFDIFPEMYNPNPETLKGYLEMMDHMIENFSLRIHVGPLKIYQPTASRLSLEAKRTGVEKEEFISTRKISWDENYKKSREVLNEYLQQRYGVGYKDAVRADVKIRVK